MESRYLELYKNMPKLPGYIHDLTVPSTHPRFVILQVLPNQRKSHAFDHSLDVSICKNTTPGIGGVFTKAQMENINDTSVRVIYQGKEETVPAWVAFDRKVLRYYAFFQESVEEMRDGHARVRKVNIYLYLEDDSIHVSEPRSANSGIPQGTLIRRHKIVNPNSAKAGQHFMIKDLNVDQEVTFYGKTFKIVACDDFTRDFLASLSIAVPANNSSPIDAFTLTRQELAARTQSKHDYHPHHQLRQFLDFDRKVLRFQCVWDDSSSKYGDVHKMEIHYYLSDDTIEIRQEVPQGSRKAQLQVFLGRCKLPKRSVGLSTSITQPDIVEYYTDKDFIIGTVVHLYGRPFTIVDCDEFTKQFYSGKLGVDASPQESEQPQKPSDIDASGQTIERRFVGIIGQGLIPPKLHNAQKYDGVVLCYSALKRSTDDFDTSRKFIINVFVYDGAISVFEKKMVGGAAGGKFLERGRVRKYPTTEYYGVADFAVGRVVEFYGHRFEIVEADEKTRLFMQDNRELFE